MKVGDFVRSLPLHFVEQQLQPRVGLDEALAPRLPGTEDFLSLQLIERLVTACLPYHRPAVTDCASIIRDGYPWWLRLFLFRNVAAITLGRRIWIASGVQGEARVRLLRHEQVHVDQMCRLGMPRFLFRYLREYLANRLHGLNADEAYRRISFEVEAFAAEEGSDQERTREG